MSWANIRLADGHRLGIGQVITHRVELENQRVYAQQLEIELEKEREMREMKDRFVSLVSHEFRTPLTIITTSLSLVTEYFDRLPPGRVLEKLGTVQQQIQRMVEMMEDALRYSRSGAGKTEFVTEPVEIFPLCQHIIETQQIMDDNRHNILLSGDTGIVQADPHLLDHIITNLLTNAIKYSPQHTTITVTITRQPAVWHFAVRDEGMGVPEADLPKLFEPFHRAANARQLPGTGLGLSIVRDYVVLHGGNIMVESEIGQGATFTFTLPA
jgi:signal transduction histidine kinase